MKRSTKIWMIVAGAMIVCGILMTTIAFAAVGFDAKKLGTIEFEDNTYEADSFFDKIDISTDADIELVYDDTSAATVVCHEMAKVRHIVEVDDATLRITTKDERKWYDHFNFSYDSAKITVHLPGRQYQSIAVTCSTGNVGIPDDFTFSEAVIRVSTGDVDMSASVRKELSIQTSTGDIRIADVEAGRIGLTASTGNITMDRVSCDSLDISSDTGNVTLTDVIANGKYEITTDTGNVIFNGCDADTLTVTTDTGNISGTLLSDKIFIARTDTGDIDVPELTSGGICRLTTDTGNIKIRIK